MQNPDSTHNHQETGAWLAVWDSQQRMQPERNQHMTPASNALSEISTNDCPYDPVWEIDVDEAGKQTYP
jgi:hypothetical protein